MKFQHQVAIGVVGASAIGWVMWRLHQRARLTEMLTASPAVQRALYEGQINWNPDQKAAELVGLSNFTSAEHAMAQVLASLPSQPALTYTEQATSYAQQAKEYLQSIWG